MDTVFRIFMYTVPYGFSIAAYIWILKKALRVPHKIFRPVSVSIVLAGLGYTAYKLISSIGRALTDDRFEFAILIVTVIVLFPASIAMALGEPEK